MNKTEGVYRGRIGRLLVMPDDGVEAVRRLIDGATRTLTAKLFEFDCGVFVAALVAAKARGVDVRVLLNPVRSSGARPNDATMATLREAGIEAGWTNPHFAITHEKSIVIDLRTVLIGTFNFSDKYFTHTRDYGLVIEDDALAEEITACFEADARGGFFQLREHSPLAWGNQNARHVVAAFIDAAEHTLLIQHPKFHDMAILDRVLAARARGVHVRFLCGGRHGIEDRDLIGTFSNQRILARAGVHLKRQHGLKLHAKLLLADDRGMLGSMNIDREAYDIRRELGLVFDHAPTLAKLKQHFEADWHAAKAYEAPDPMRLDLKNAVDAEPEDPATALIHE